jgi:hypothetical protein
MLLRKRLSLSNIATPSVVLVLLSLFFWLPLAVAQGRGGVLRLGMTAADIPYTGGQPDQGGEGYRFIGFQLYDALINWDLSQGERLPQLVPALVVGNDKGRSYQVDFPSAAWGEVSRWHGLQRGRGDMEHGPYSYQRGPAV